MAKLGELYSITSGGTPSRNIPEYYSNGNIPWVKTGDLKQQYIYSVSEYITQEGLKKSAARIYPPDTVLLAMYGATIGACSILKIDAATNQACAAFSRNNDVIPEYLYAYFESQKSRFAKEAFGGAQPNISIGYLKGIEIQIPNILIQKQIVDRDNGVNNLISLRKQQLSKLNDLVKSQFIEMFGDPSYKLVELISLITNGSGLSYGIVQPGDDGTGNMGVLRPVDLIKGKISTASIKCIDRSIGNGYRKTALTGEELLISVRGTTGITALTDSRFNGMNVTRGIAVIRYNEKIVNPVYLNEYLKSDESQRYISEHTKGATLQQINLSDLRVQKILLPPFDLQNQFAAFVQQVDKSKFEIQKSLENLETLKKVLMQQYFG